MVLSEADRQTSLSSTEAPQRLSGPAGPQATPAHMSSCRAGPVPRTDPLSCGLRSGGGTLPTRVRLPSVVPVPEPKLIAQAPHALSLQTVSSSGHLSEHLMPVTRAPINGVHPFNTLLHVIYFTYS